MARKEGVVKWFNERKGFGFIEVQGEPDVFVHYTGIAGAGFKSLEDGVKVTFTVESGPKGPVAKEVEVIK